MFLCLVSRARLGAAKKQSCSVWLSILWLVSWCQHLMCSTLMMALWVAPRSLFWQILLLFWINHHLWGLSLKSFQVRTLCYKCIFWPLCQWVVVSGSRCSAPGLIRGNFVGLSYYSGSTVIKFESKLSCIQTLMSHLETLFANDAFYLLRHCFAIPKLLYLLHTSPS